MTDPTRNDGLLAECAETSPWTGDNDYDWCFYCSATQRVYGPKPWSGHRPDCFWIRVNDALGRDTAHLIGEAPA